VRRDAKRGQQLELNIAPHRIGVRGDGPVAQTMLKPARAAASPIRSTSRPTSFGHGSQAGIAGRLKLLKVVNTDRQLLAAIVLQRGIA